MDKRPPLCIPVLLFVVVLGTLLLAVVWEQSPTQAPAAASTDLDQWLKDNADSWLGRITNVTTIVGLGIGMYALVVARRALRVSQHQLDAIQADQARIAEELSRRPELRVSIGSGRDSAYRTAGGLVYGRPAARHRRLHFAVTNVGRKSAHNPRAEIHLPAGMEAHYLNNAGAPAQFQTIAEFAGLQPNPFDVDPPRAGLIPAMNYLIHVTDLEDPMHPDRTVGIRFSAVFPEVNVDYEVEIEVTYDDWPGSKFTFWVGVYDDPPTRGCDWPRRPIFRLPRQTG